METIKTIDTASYQNQEKTKYLVFGGLSLVMLAIGLFYTHDISNILAGLKVIFTHPSRIDFDTFYWVQDYGMGIPYISVALNILMVLLVYRVTDTKIMGSQIAALGMVIGFGFYGKNILNMWFPLLGVFLHTKLQHKPLSSGTALGFFAACVAPFFNTYAFDVAQLDPGSPKALLVGALLAVLVGFLASIFASYFPNLHGGLLLYNAGLAAGWAAVVVYSALKAMGMGLENPGYGDAYVLGQNKFFYINGALLFLYLILAGLLLKGIPGFKKLFWYKSPGGDHLEQFGFAGVILTMGITGLLALTYPLLVGGDLNGTIYIAIWAAASFTAFGSTLRTQLPLILGVALGAFLTGGLVSVQAGNGFLAGALSKVGVRGMIQSALFTCGVSPIVGRYGKRAGIITGMVHSVVVVNTAILHGWLSLYNNGFSLGIITILLFPVYCYFYRDHNPKAVSPKAPVKTK